MQHYFFIRSSGKYIRIEFNEILYVEGCKNYLKIVTKKRNWLVLMSITKMEQALPAHLFKRIHRSYIVSIDQITEFTRDTVFLKDKELPIGMQYKGQLEKAVNILSNEFIEQSLTVPLTYLTQKAYAV